MLIGIFDPRIEDGIEQIDDEIDPTATAG